METADGNVHTISIQSIIGKDQYQEVATIIVEKDLPDPVLEEQNIKKIN